MANIAGAPDMSDTPLANIVRLPDGRRLCYAGFGAAGGYPLLYCHGFPASRLEAGLFDAAACRLNLQVIAPDRPGYGRSDFLAGRRIGDWASDMEALADYLGWQRFAVLGVSGGAPYAMACGERLGGRVSRLGLVCPLGQLCSAEATLGMGLLAAQAIRFAREGPFLAGWIYVHLVGPLMRRHPLPALSLLTVAAPQADRQVLRDPAIRQMLAGSVEEAFRQGGKGAAHDLYLYTRPWDIVPDEIAAETHLWHGEADRTVPVAMGRQLAALIPGCHATFYPEEGHFSLPIRHAEAILAVLAGNR
jgi:pimeloyl-ACP methyl ester carboxylesterase